MRAWPANNYLTTQANMATVQINQATAKTHSSSQPHSQGSSGFPDELQAVMSLAEIPDPGGGPPPATAEGRASNPGPNAQSNQPDFLPLLDSTGLPLLSPGGPQSSGTATKGGKGTTTDPTILALAGAFGAAMATGVVVPVTTDEPNAASTPVTSISIAKLPGLADQTPPDPAANPVSLKNSAAPQASTAQSDELLHVIVDQPTAAQSAHPLPGIQNSAVSAVATKDISSPILTDLPAVTPTSADAQPQSSFGASTGDHNPNQQQPASEQNSANMAGQVSIPGQLSVASGMAVPAGPTLSDPQRLDVVRQLADRIELMAASRPQQGVTIHLQPHGLGDVTVVVKGIGKDIEATFSATNTAVRTALADSRDALTQAVTAKGYNLIGVSIAAHSQSMSGRDRQPTPNQQQSQSFGNPSSSGGPNGSSNSRGGGSLPSTVSTLGMDDEAELPSTGADGVDYRI